MTEPTNNPNGAAVYTGAPWAFRRAIAQGKSLVTPTWGMGDTAIALVGAAILGVTTSVVLVLAHTDPANGWGLIVSTTAPWIFLAGWPIFSSWQKGNGARLDFGLLATSAQIRLGLIAGVIAITAGGLIGIIQQQITGPVSSAAGDIAKNQQGLVLFVFILMMIFGAPIVEEIAFRGLLFSSLVKAQVSGYLAVGVSALVFALFHFEPSRILILLAIGLVLGEVRRRTGSTLASIATHCVVNTPAALVIGLSALGFGPGLN